MIRFRSIGSGSGGNATVVEASSGITTTRLLVDAGFSLKELDDRLARAGLAAADLDAVFVTHEHGDHIGCALALAERERLPVWMSRGTWRATGGFGSPSRAKRSISVMPKPPVARQVPRLIQTGSRSRSASARAQPM